MLTLYTKPDCTRCNDLKKYLKKYVIPYKEMKIGEDITRDILIEKFPDLKLLPIVTYYDVPMIDKDPVKELKKAWEEIPDDEKYTIRREMYISALLEYQCQVIFNKLNGTERKLNCKVDIPKEDRIEWVNDNRPLDYIHVIDSDTNKFKTIIYDNIKEFNVIG